MTKKKSRIKYCVVPVSEVTFEHRFKDDKPNSIIKASNEYINKTSKNVMVIDRNGFRYIVEPIKKGIITGRFVIRSLYQFLTPEDVAYGKKFFDSVSIESGQYPQLKLLKESFMEQYKRIEENRIKFNRGMHDFVSISIKLESIYPDNEIHHHDIYAADHDVVVSMKELDDSTVSHPTDTLESTRRKHELLTTGHQGYGFNIELIDNEDRFEHRYIFIGGNLVKVRTVRNESLADGVYLTTVEQGVDGPKKDTVHFEFGELEKKIGLWPTQEEAETNGNPEIIKKLQLTDLTVTAQRELHEQKLETERVTQKYKQEEIERKRRLAELEDSIAEKTRFIEAQRQENERQMTELKQRYEEKRMRDAELFESKSYKRKDTNEYIKLAGVVVAASIAIWGALRKA